MYNTKKTTMIKKHIFILFFFTLLFYQVNGQTFKQQFNDLVSKEDTIGQQELLEKWEQIDKDDPELYVAYFNYYVRKSMSEILTLGQNPEGNEVLQITDMDTTIKEPVAFFYGDTYYDPDYLNKGFDWISKGIEKYPDRLDMRFGKIYMLGQLEDYENFTTEIIATIDYSFINKNKWIWADSKPLDDPKKFMLNSIQDYQFQLYNTEDDELLDNMKSIAEDVLKYYPDHVESLSNLSIVFLIREDYNEALEILLRTEKLVPTDYIVLSNIALTYKLKGDDKNAIKYYELTLKYGDDDAKKYAQGQIEELKKK